MARHLAALSLQPDDAVAYVREVEKQAAACQPRGLIRRQIYSTGFAAEALLLTVVRLTKSRQMSPWLAAEMFGAGPRQPAGPGVFLASSPRLCDRWHTPEVVEESLGSGFVLCYLLDLLQRGSEAEAELGLAVRVFEGVLFGWRNRQKLTWMQVGWAPVLEDIASALVCVTESALSPASLDALDALARVEDAADGVSLAVAAALKKYPWAVRAQNARSNQLRALVFSQASLLSRFAGLFSSSAETGAEPAQASPELSQRSTRKRKRSRSPDVFNVSEAVGAARHDDIRRRGAVFLAAARLDQPLIWLDGGAPLRLTLFDGCAAAVKCRGMNLGDAELGRAFSRIAFFVRAACTSGGILKCGSVEQADLVLTAVDCGVALAEAMGIPGSFAAEAPPALVAATCSLISLSGVLRIRTALDAADAVEDSLRINEGIADTASDSSSASDPSSASDSSSDSNSDSDVSSTGHSAGARAALSSS